MTKPPERPPHCPGVIQRVIHQEAESPGFTEWLRVLVEPIEWTRDPLEALVFHDDEHAGGKTGYERAAIEAKRLSAALGCLVYAVTRSRPTPQDPPMPRGFFSNGRRDRDAREETDRLRRHDWREGVPNAGID